MRKFKKPSEIRQLLTNSRSGSMSETGSLEPSSIAEARPCFSAIRVLLMEAIVHDRQRLFFVATFFSFCDFFYAIPRVLLEH